QHHVRTQRLGQVHRLVARARLAGDGDVGLALESLLETGTDDFVVVHDRHVDAVQGLESWSDAVAVVRNVPLHPLRHSRSPRLSARLCALSKPRAGYGQYTRTR